MIANAKQESRILAVHTVLGPNKLLLRSFSGREELSRLYSYDLELLSADDSIDASSIVGQPICFEIRHLENPREFSGWVKQFAYTGQTKNGTAYRATVVPWLWFLTQSTDCRIFQHKTVPQIIRQVFQDLGFGDFNLIGLREAYQPREYCVQYRESDFDFVSRLMEEEGIFYYFKHADGKQTLMLCDHTATYYELGNAEVDFGDPTSSGDLRDQITRWQHDFTFCPGRWSQTDYNFKSPRTDLASKEASIVHCKNSHAYEIYEYPGQFADTDLSKKRTRIRMEEFEVPHDKVTGSSTYRSFAPGGRFAVRSHLSESEVGKEFVLTAVETSASVNGSYITGTETDELQYENRFECIPRRVSFRPAFVTRRPIVEGPQTAVITGPRDEEIYTDEFGRVKVQFHWDRVGQYDENTSCWLRVSQVHAGKGWGSMDLPRVGEEVIVDFLEGNPDRPLITGRVYNAEAMPPFELPAGKTRRGNTSKTYKGNGYNEMSMDDTPGAEQIRMNAQHNMDSNVNNNQSTVIGVDQTSDIGNNDTLTIGNDASESVGNNKSTKVANNMSMNVGSKLNVNAGSSITLKCGASKIYMNSGGIITIQGTIITTVAAANAAVVAPLTQIVGGGLLTTLGGVNMMTGAVCKVASAGLASVSGSKVDVAASGTTAIKGGMITLN